jgi:hypothetical protein
MRRNRDVRFGSKADIGVRPHNVRFTPKADMDQHGPDVRFVPILLQKTVEGFFGQ